jgi:hypothetical protein
LHRETRHSESRSVSEGNPKSQEIDIRPPISCNLDYFKPRATRSFSAASEFFTGDYVDPCMQAKGLPVPP